MTPFCASIYARMPSALTEPTVAAKYERVHKDGNLLKIGLKLLSQVERGDPFQFFDDLSGAIRRQDPDKDVDVIGLDSQFKDLPTLALAFLLASSCWHRSLILSVRIALSASGTPDQVI